MKGFYNLDDILSISIRDVCNYLGVPVEQHGGSCFCKLRDEKTASCRLYLDNSDGHDSFYDFGSHVGGSVINFVEQRLGCDWQGAVEELARVFSIEPINNSDYFNRNELTDLEYKKIGVYGDLATKNFEFDLERFSLESVQKYSEKYAMPVNQLRKDYPSKYAHDIIKKRAIPFVYSLRNKYYFHLYCCLSIQKTITGHFDINNVPHSDLQECKELCKEVEKAENLLKKALRGTDITYTFKDYNILEDLKKLYYGEIAFEVGENSYAEVKRESQRHGVDLRYRSLDVDDYMALSDYGINSVLHAAFLKNDKVNLAFLPEQSELIDKCIGLYKESTRDDMSDTVAVSDVTKANDRAGQKARKAPEER